MSGTATAGSGADEEQEQEPTSRGLLDWFGLNGDVYGKNNHFDGGGGDVPHGSVLQRAKTMLATLRVNPISRQ